MTWDIDIMENRATKMINSLVVRIRAEGAYK